MSNLQKHLGVDAARFNDPVPTLDLIRKQQQAANSFQMKRTQTRIRPTSLAYVPRDREEFCACEYDLGEIARAMDTESLVKKAVDALVILCMKEGYKIAGKNPRTVRYIKKRLREFEYGTLISTRQLFREALFNLIAFHNSFLVFRRDAAQSSGMKTRKFGSTQDPIAGIFVADPSSFHIQRNRWGDVKRYKQTIRGDFYFDDIEKFFEPADVVHVTINRKSGMAFGTPFQVASLDDIRLLRNLEELANMMVHKGTFPLLHWKVGTEKKPAIDFQDGSSEITQVEDSIIGRDAEGIFVTSERHEINAVELRMLDVTKYLDYFRSRVMSGLGLSTVDLGEGDTANRGTAVTMTKSIQHRCKDYQVTLSDAVNMIFDDLLLEGGFDISDEDRVYLVFPEIDIETQQIVQNHQMALYQGHAITEDEMRLNIGLEPIEEMGQEKLFLNKVQIPLAREQADAKASAAIRTAAAKNTPSNQSGTKSSAAGRKKNDDEIRDRVHVALLNMRLDNLFGALHESFHAKFPNGGMPVSDRVARLVAREVADLVDASQFGSMRATCEIFDAMQLDTIDATLGYARARLGDLLCR